jgi:membrane peptidoglycan carboxypeptidase
VRGLLLVGVLVGSLGFAAFAFLVARTEIPNPSDVVTSQATVVYYAGGKQEIGRLTDTTRQSIPLAEVPLHTQQAVLAAEDRGFYDHGGISPLGIVRAALNNTFTDSTQGGSTITQQYAKNAYLTQERSWQRKIKEALLAFKLETIVSKDTILENYLNTSFFGRDAEGIQAASMAYFRIPAGQLTVEQSAVLAALLKSPGGLSPEENLTGLQGRWAYVMDGMRDEGWITDEQRDAAQFPEIAASQSGNRLGGQTGYILTAVQEQLKALGFDDEQIQSGGLRIVTTIERRAQRSAERAVRTQGPTSNTKGLRIGLAAVRPGTGEIVAMYGGKDFITDQINNATKQFAQAGSTFKPFALAAAIDEKVPLKSVWSGDSPITVQGYTLNNYDNKSYGSVTLLEATEKSINSAYVEMESSLGVKKVARAALRAGIPKSTPGLNLDNLDLTFVLGTASPSAVDMANAYATFAARGVTAPTTVIRRVMGPNEGVLWEYQPAPDRAFPEEVADTVTFALNRTVNNGTGFAARELGRPAAGKTGTTDGNKSAWFVGYTPQLAAAVLMAKEVDGTPVSLSGTGGLRTVTGGSFPAAIWTAFMNGALKGLPEEPFTAPPDDVLREPDCPAVLAPDMQEVPLGCPIPDVVTEFGPDGMVDEAPPEEIPAPEEPVIDAAPQDTTFDPQDDGRSGKKKNAR